MVDNVHRQDGRVWLPDVRGWSPAEKQSSVHAAQETVLHALGETIGYTELIGASALAFRMQVSKQGLCPSSPHSAVGYRCLKGSLDASPWRFEIFEAKPGESEKILAARRAVVEAIDNGRPSFYGNEEDGVIVGYEQNGEAWLCYHPYRQWGQELFVETNWPWGLAVPKQPKDAREIESRYELTKRALRQALTMASTREAGKYDCGAAAWQRYLQALREYRATDPQTDQVMQLGNAWIYRCLIGYRRCAADYLRAVAGDFPSGALPHLQSAATHYETMATRLLCDESRPSAQVAPFPGPNSPPWTEELRREQMTRLEETRDVESQALSEIEQAMGSLS